MIVPARVKMKIQVVKKSPWLRFPRNLGTEINRVKGAVIFFLILTANQPTPAEKIKNVKIFNCTLDSVNFSLYKESDSPGSSSPTVPCIIRQKKGKANKSR